MQADAELIGDFLLSLYRSAREAPVAQYPEIAMDLMQPLLQFRSGWLGGGTGTPHGVDVHHAHLYREPTEMRTAYQEVRHLDKAVMNIPKQTTALTVVHAPTFFGGQALAPMLNYTRRFGHMSILLATRRDSETGYIEWMSLFRPDPDYLWNERTCRLAALLFPHFMEALALNRAEHHEWMNGHRHEIDHALATADMRGYLLQAEPEFLRMVCEEWTQDIRQKKRIPDDVAAHLADGKTWRGRRIAVTVRIGGVFMFLRARLLSDVDCLTSREWAIAQLLSQGLNYRAVAKEISVTPQTAKTYIKGLYEKLSVRNRAELCAVVHRMK